ncbi:MAG: type II toxin-antitoxin system RelB/DinJ family antitoxin [Propionibacteriaceae bacterium]|jgi:DNA-damage-inducible protein J|nr:type II toxin-antitoxin system RelB/DinJ family antitoxin [Propionibacteriaceae bacterium]
MKTATLSMRIDPEVKAAAEELFSDFGLSMSDAVTIFLHQAILEEGLPFEVRRPERRRKATEESGEEEATPVAHVVETSGLTRSYRSHSGSSAIGESTVEVVTTPQETVMLGPAPEVREAPGPRSVITAFPSTDDASDSSIARERRTGERIEAKRYFSPSTPSGSTGSSRVITVDTTRSYPRYIAAGAAGGPSDFDVIA